MFRPWRERTVARNVVPQLIVLRYFRYRYPLKVPQKVLLNEALLTPRGTVQAAVTYGLGYVMGLDGFGFVHIGNGA